MMKRLLPALALMLTGHTEHVFRDCRACPQMVEIPAGTYLMGSPAADPHRDTSGTEEPQHRVTIAYAFAVGKYDVTRDEYAEFVRDTRLPDPLGCNFHVPPHWPRIPSLNWHNTGFHQTGSDPAVCVSWNEAVAYTKWLSQKTGHPYRLLTESEYEYVARAGTTGQAYWGDDTTMACAYENGPDSSLLDVFPEQRSRRTDAIACRDGYVYTSPAGRFKPNAFGVYDIMGNVFTWVQDCLNDSYKGAPTDGSARLDGNCASRINRGGSWTSTPFGPRVAQRGWDNATTTRVVDLGFRVARDGTSR